MTFFPFSTLPYDNSNYKQATGRPRAGPVGSIHGQKCIASRLVGSQGNVAVLNERDRRHKIRAIDLHRLSRDGTLLQPKSVLPELNKPISNFGLKQHDRIGKRV